MRTLVKGKEIGLYYPKEGKKKKEESLDKEVYGLAVEILKESRHILDEIEASIPGSRPSTQSIWDMCVEEAKRMKGVSYGKRNR